MTKGSPRAVLRRSHFGDRLPGNTQLHPYPKGMLYSGTIPIPRPQMDWEVLRRLKVQCELLCAEFDHVNGSCRFGLVREGRCARFRFGGFSKEVSELNSEILVEMFRG